ncbi:MAG: DNA gyrase subunit A [Clostridia bacterium]|nr:DNA gyrase subunit A [Clostridia bacterium]
MLADIKKDTIDWMNAYTDEEQEPVYLPGKIPNLLVNGTTGIAVGMACSFAPHNLKEIMDAAIHVLLYPECDIKELLEIVTGPDFPTGGLLINKDELTTAYLTGRGRARVRGEYHIESDKNGDTIVFDSIPYKVSKDNLTIELDKLCEAGELNGVITIRDETNAQGVRFVIELAKGVSAEPIIKKIYAKTKLEDTYSFNQVALVDKKPRLLNLKQLLVNYIEHQRDVLIRKSKFEYAKAEARAHILQGLLKALEDIDNIIQLIKKSESAAKAKENLISKYAFTEPQAKAILDMKLSKLANLEKIEIQNEYNEKIAEMITLSAIIKDPTPALTNLFDEIKQKFGDERRTKITQISESKEEKEIEFIEPEKCVVVMSEDGLIKRIPSSSFRTQHRNGKGVKTLGDITSAVIKTNTIDSLMVFTNKGKMYRILVNDIPVGTNATKGQSIKSLIAMDTNEEATLIYSIYRDTNAKYILFVTKNGVIKKTSLDEYTKTKKKTGIAAIGLKEGDTLASVGLCSDEDLILLTHEGMGIKISLKEIPTSSRTAMGIKGITLKEDDYVVAALPVRHTTDQLAIFAESGLGKKIKLEELPVQKRAGKGLMVYKPTSSSGKIVCGTLVEDSDMILLIGPLNSICISAKDIPLLSRPSLGNIMMKGVINSVTKV